MKSGLLVFLLYTSVVLLFGTSFETSYPLYGLEDISDQTFVKTQEGDEYFFALVDGVLKIKKRELGTEVFDDFLLDSGSYNFKSVIDIELAIYSGNRDVIYFTTERESGYELVKLSFEDSVITLDVIQTFEEVISDLYVMNSHSDEIKLSYVQSETLQICGITYSGIWNHYDTGITGKYIKLKSYYNLHNLDNIIQSFYFTYSDGNYHMWYLEINHSNIAKQYVKPLLLDEVDTFSIDIITGVRCFYSKGDYKTYYRVIDHFCSYVTTTSEEESGYYRVGEELVYCIKFNDKFIRLDLLEVVEEFYFADDLTFYDGNNSGLVDNNNEIISLADKTPDIGILNDYDQIIPMGDFIMYFHHEVDNMFELYCVGPNSTEVLHMQEVEIADDLIIPILDIDNKYIKLMGSDYIFSLNTYCLLNINNHAIRLNDYLLYRDDSGLYYLGVDR